MAERGVQEKEQGSASAAAIRRVTVLAAWGKTFKSGADATIAPAHDGTMTCATRPCDRCKRLNIPVTIMQSRRPRHRAPAGAGHFSLTTAPFQQEIVRAVVFKPASPCLSRN
jgi:hypothetical protein